MDVPCCPPPTSSLLDCQAVLGQIWDTDQGYFSSTSSLSPTSSVDSFCFSPGSLCPVGGEVDALDLLFAGPLSSETPPPTPSAPRRSRSRFPGRKRQTASEREKMRMRDLTGALHHLRSFLPPSVAPQGQTLTKIDTLRLSIRYIERLSAQLDQDQEVMESGRSWVQAGQTHQRTVGFCSGVLDHISMATMEQQNQASTRNLLQNPLQNSFQNPLQNSVQNSNQGSAGFCCPWSDQRFWTV